MLRIRDVYPRSRILIFVHPGSKNSNKREEWKKICCHTFFCGHKFHKIENYFIFELLKNKIWTNFQRIKELFIKKIVTKLSQIWVWDPGKIYPGYRIPDQGSKRHRIPDPQHWFLLCFGSWLNQDTNGSLAKMVPQKRTIQYKKFHAWRVLFRLDWRLFPGPECPL